MNVALITGVNGQDGSYLAELLLSKGYTVFGMKRRSSNSNVSRLKGIINNPNFILEEGDVSDYFSVDRLMHKTYMCLADKVGNGLYPKEKAPYFEVYNLAAQSHVHTSFAQPGYTFDVNFKGVLNILEASRLYSNNCRIYQASTSEMFGDKYSTGFNNYRNIPAFDFNYSFISLTDEIQLLKYQDENTPFSPMSPYAVAKVAAHQLVNNYRKAYGIHASCGILFNHEGPRRGEEFLTQKVCKYVAELTHSIFRGDMKTPKLKLGNLDSYRDFGFAGDYVEAMWLMLQQDKPDDYVIATGVTTKIEDFVKKAFDYIGEDYKNWVEIDQSLKRPSEVDFLKGDATKAKEKLGWEPKVNVDQLIKMMIDEYGQTV